MIGITTNTTGLRILLTIHTKGPATRLINAPAIRHRSDYFSRWTPYYGHDYYSGPCAGLFVGYGPRGYHRSDERIQDDINDRLTWDGRIDATDVHVQVRDGLATLSGVTDSRYEKRVAEEIAEQEPGVWDVDNEIRVRQHRGQPRSRAQEERSTIHEDMQVVDSRGDYVGQVKEVRSEDFLLDRPLARDVYVPFDSCQVSGNEVHLNILVGQVSDQDWERPPLLRFESSYTEP